MVSSSAGSASTIYIAVGVIAALLILCCIIVILLLVVRRRKRQQKQQPQDVLLEEPKGDKTAYQSLPGASKLDTNQTSNQRQSGSIRAPTYQINYSDLTLGDKIGAGAYGEVYKGKWRGAPVAIKRLFSSLSEKAKNDFFSEAGVMR